MGEETAGAGRFAWYGLRMLSLDDLEVDVVIDSEACADKAGCLGCDAITKSTADGGSRCAVGTAREQIWQYTEPSTHRRPSVIHMSDIEIKVRSAVEARSLALSGWATAIVSAVDEWTSAIQCPPHLPGDHQLILTFDDVTSARMGQVAVAEDVRTLVEFGRALPAGSRVLIHCRGGIGRSPACALAIYVARGESMPSAIDMVLGDRPQAQPNPLVVLLLDEVLCSGGGIWLDYHRWAFRQTWWVSGLAPDSRRSIAATRAALRSQTHRRRPRR